MDKYRYVETYKCQFILLDSEIHSCSTKLYFTLLGKKNVRLIDNATLKSHQLNISRRKVACLSDFYRIQFGQCPRIALDSTRSWKHSLSTAIGEQAWFALLFHSLSDIQTNAITVPLEQGRHFIHMQIISILHIFLSRQRKRQDGAEVSNPSPCFLKINI